MRNILLGGLLAFTFIPGDAYVNKPLYVTIEVVSQQNTGVLSTTNGIPASSTSTSDNYPTLLSRRKIVHLSNKYPNLHDEDLHSGEELLGSDDHNTDSHDRIQSDQKSKGYGSDSAELQERAEFLSPIKRQVYATIQQSDTETTAGINKSNNINT